QAIFPSGAGGAISNASSSDGSLTVTNSTFSGNQNGTISSEGSSDTVTNSTFYGNAAQLGGSAIDAYSMTVTDCKFSDNQTAPPSFPGQLNGGALCLPQAVPQIYKISVQGSLFANNTGGNCCAGGAEPTNEGYNISDDDTCDFGISTGAKGQTIGDNVKPLLASGLADNGGPTETIALIPGSPAIEAVPLAQCTVRTDQRGDPRPEPGFSDCDIGAYEYQGLRRKKKPLWSPRPMSRSRVSNSRPQFR